MAKSVFALPVSLEQLAAVIRQLSPVERQRLLELVPELRAATTPSPPRSLDELRASAEQLRQEVAQALGGQLLSLDEPFVDDLTLGQYLDLPDEERARLWNAWEDRDLNDLEERNVRSDTLPAG